jgi:hypothetical protein
MSDLSAEVSLNVPENKLTRDLGLVTSELIAKVANLQLEKPEKHPWLSYLENLLKGQRLVSRRGMEPINFTDDLNGLVESCIEKLSSELYFQRGSPTKVSECLVASGEEYKSLPQPHIIVFNELSSIEEITKAVIESPDQAWMAIGQVKDEQGKVYLFSAGDHLAADGNVHMKVFADLQGRLKIEGNEEGVYANYTQGEKNVLTRLVDPKLEVNHRYIYTRLVSSLRQAGQGLSVVMPIQTEVAGARRLLPMQLDIEDGATPKELNRQLSTVIGLPPEQKWSSTSITWIRLLHETGELGKRVFHRLRSLPLGKAANRYLSGHLLYSVMDVGEPVASTTIIPNPDSLVCTIVRDPETKAVLSCSLSGNRDYWPEERLAELHERLWQ